MTYKTHFNFGVLLSLLIINMKYRSPLEYILCILIAGIAALIPDFDHKNSYISNKVSPIWLIVLFIYVIIYFDIMSLLILILWLVITYFSKHRTFSHSLLGLIMFILPFMGTKLLYPVFIGYTSHLLSDMLTVEGIPLFYPFNKIKIKLLKIKCNSPFERLLMIILFLINVILIMNYLISFF